MENLPCLLGFHDHIQYLTGWLDLQQFQRHFIVFQQELRAWRLWSLRCFHRCANISHLRTHLGRNTCVIVLGDVRSHVCRFLSCEFQRFLGLNSIMMLISHFRKSKKNEKSIEQNIQKSHLRCGRWQSCSLCRPMPLILCNRL